LPAGSSLQGGTASAKLASAGPLDRLVTTGFLGLENTRLAGFNLGSKMSAIEKFAGIKGGPDTDFQTLQANVRVASEGTALDDIRVVAPAIGELAGAGTVSAAKALDFKMRATLHTSGGVMAVLGQKGDTSIPFFIAGTASDPVFRPDVKAVAAEKAKALATEQVKTLGEGAVGKAAGGLIDSLFGKKKQQ
jgi:AsmA protein